jgi:hypothetical protein
MATAMALSIRGAKRPLKGHALPREFARSVVQAGQSAGTLGARFLFRTNDFKSLKQKAVIYLSTER